MTGRVAETAQFEGPFPRRRHRGLLQNVSEGLLGEQRAASIGRAGAHVGQTGYSVVPGVCPMRAPTRFPMA